MILMYRKASPRTGKTYESKHVNRKNRPKFLKAGWIYEPVFTRAEIATYPEEELLAPEKTVRPKTIPFSELSDSQIEEIKGFVGTIKDTSEKFNISIYTARKIKVF